MHHVTFRGINFPTDVGRKGKVAPDLSCSSKREDTSSRDISYEEIDKGVHTILYPIAFLLHLLDWSINHDHTQATYKEDRVLPKKNQYPGLKVTLE
jgi:hypothetical protein